MIDDTKITNHLEAMTLYPSLLVSGVASGALKEMRELERQNSIMREALEKLASWSDGFNVFDENGESHFCEPFAASAARRAIYKCEEVEE